MSNDPKARLDALITTARAILEHKDDPHLRVDAVLAARPHFSAEQRRAAIEIIRRVDGDKLAYATAKRSERYLSGILLGSIRREAEFGARADADKKRLADLDALRTRTDGTDGDSWKARFDAGLEEIRDLRKFSRRTVADLDHVLAKRKVN